jgi:ATP-dependent exoDNAse (exonuclease V) beta subunit
LACKVLDRETNRAVGTFAYNRADALRKEREDAERKRLLYVAATRAQDLLVVSGQVSHDRNGKLKANGWLEWLVDALDLAEIDSLERQMHDCGWGIADVRFPMLDDADRAEVVRAADVLKPEQIRAETSRAVQTIPPLLAPVPHEPDALARAMTAAQIGDLGGAIYAEDKDRFAFIERWQRKVLHNAPARIEPIMGRRDDVSPGKVSDIVHKALRWWKPSTAERDLRQRLDAVAWEEGIVDPEVRQITVNRAYDLMQNVLNSDVYEWIRQAETVYPELPFVFHTEKRLIHGVIDVLMLRSDGSWALVDYKTGFAAAQPDRATLAEHARRYHLQVGVYAAAAQQLLGIDQIDVYIHYIRHEQTVEIPVEAWQSALERLEDHIGELIEMDIS